MKSETSRRSILAEAIQLGVAAGLPDGVWFHYLRHCASLLIALGVDVQVVEMRRHVSDKPTSTPPDTRGGSG